MMLRSTRLSILTAAAALISASLTGCRQEERSVPPKLASRPEVGLDEPPDLRPAASRIASLFAEGERAEAEELLLTEALPAEYAARRAVGDAPDLAWRLAEKEVDSRLQGEAPLYRLVILRDLRYLADYRVMRARASVLSQARYAKEHPEDFARLVESRPFGLNQALELSALDIAQEAAVLGVRYQLWLFAVQTPAHYGVFAEIMRSPPGAADLSDIIEYARTGRLLGDACGSAVARWLGRPGGRLILR